MFSTLNLINLILLFTSLSYLNTLKVSKKKEKVSFLLEKALLSVSSALQNS